MSASRSLAIGDREMYRASRSSLSRWQGFAATPACSEKPELSAALIFVRLIEGLKVREAREPTLDKALLEKALREIVAALISPPK